jgi:hypothetical protein
MRRHGFKAFDLFSLISLCCAIGIIALSAYGFEVQVEDPFNGWYLRVELPLYHDGHVYCLDPFWMASFFLVLPSIWVKRRMIELFRREEKSN